MGHAAVINANEDADEQAEDHRQQQVAVPVRDLYKTASLSNSSPINI